MDCAIPGPAPGQMQFRIDRVWESHTELSGYRR